MVNLESLFPESIRQANPSQLDVTGAWPVALWRSQVDHRTGDGIHVPYTLFWMTTAPGSSVAIPAVAHLPRANLVERLEDPLGIPGDGLPEGSHGLTVPPLDDDDAGVEGRSWAFVSVVDTAPATRPTGGETRNARPHGHGLRHGHPRRGRTGTLAYPSGGRAKPTREK